MTFSPEWNAVYAAGRERVRWPWSDVVSLVSRHCPDLRGMRVLELGCGSGANIPFFTTVGADYAGIDGSEAAVSDLNGAVVVADFTESIPFFDMDLIFDRAAVAHNDTLAIQSCLELVYEALKPSGLYIGVDWFSHLHHEYANSDPDADEFTKSDYTQGQFAGVGRVHFSDEGHLRRLFHRFEWLHLEEKVRRDAVTGDIAATWNLVVRKPA